VNLQGWMLNWSHEGCMGLDEVKFLHSCEVFSLEQGVNKGKTGVEGVSAGNCNIKKLKRTAHKSTGDSASPI
jgi:hypothetical protein